MRNRAVGLLSVVVLMTAGAAQADSRIGFASDRQGDFAIFKSRIDGTGVTQVTDQSGQAHNATISPSGGKVIYDVGDVLYMNDFANPIGEPVLLGGGSDPDASGYINLARDFRIIYTIGVGGQTQIYMATVDISENELVDEVALTSSSFTDNYHPSFCGTSHFVWIHDDTYQGELCYQEFDEDGPVGSATCWFSGLDDAKVDAHPDCDSTGTYVAWARESEDYAGTHDIWKMPTSGDEEDAETIQAEHADETMPVWSPSNSQIAFASNKVWPPGSSANDYEIWRIDSTTGSGDEAVTENDGVDDIEPAWGPATLP